VEEAGGVGPQHLPQPPTREETDDILHVLSDETENEDEPNEAERREEDDKEY
jgi:hypothetical protein